MRLGLLGIGHQGQKYIKTLKGMGVELAWASNSPRYDADSIIIATPAQTHYELAKRALELGRNVLIEKPMVMDLDQAKELYDLALKKNVTGFVDHTHLYSPAWREMKKKGPFRCGFFTAGGQCETDPRWDWGSHGAAMCIDLNVPVEMNIKPGRVMFFADRLVYDDPFTIPRPMEVLMSEFLSSEHDQSGIKMGVEVTKALCESESITSATT